MSFYQERQIKDQNFFTKDLMHTEVGGKNQSEEEDDLGRLGFVAACSPFGVPFATYNERERTTKLRLLRGTVFVALLRHESYVFGCCEIV